MKDRIENASPRKIARIAGVAYLGTIVFGILGQAVRASLFVPANPVETAQNIVASFTLFRIGFVSDLAMTVCYLLWGFGAYLLLRTVNKTVALLMAVINFVGAPIMALNMLNQFAAQVLLSGAGYLQAFPPEQLRALALFFIDLQNYGYLVGAISFGLYLFPLGYLVYKSNLFPRVFGIGYLVLGSVTMIDFITQFLLPRYAAVSQVLLYPMALVEISFCLWLLVKGARTAPHAAA